MTPGGSLPRPHIHPRAEERFEVVDGRVQIMTAGRTRVANAGETVIVQTDVRDFTPFAETNPAVEVVARLNALFEIEGKSAAIQIFGLNPSATK